MRLTLENLQLIPLSKKAGTFRLIYHGRPERGNRLGVTARAFFWTHEVSTEWEESRGWQQTQRREGGS